MTIPSTSTGTITVETAGVVGNFYSYPVTTVDGSTYDEWLRWANTYQQPTVYSPSFINGGLYAEAGHKEESERELEDSEELGEFLSEFNIVEDDK